MAHISIALDTWKLPIYERHLTEAGYTCQAGPGLIADDPDHISLRIAVYEMDDALSAALQAAAMEAAWPGGPPHDGEKK